MKSMQSERVKSMKRKQPAGLPVQPKPQKINVLSDVVVSSAVAKPKGSGAVVSGCGGTQQQVVNLGPPQRPSSPPILQLSEHDFEAVNPEVLAIVEELERATKCPKLDTPSSAPQNTAGPEAGPSNLGNEDGNCSQYSIPDVPPLLSPLPKDDSDIEFVDPGFPKKSVGKPPYKKDYKKGGSKTTTPILKGALENRAGCSGWKLTRIEDNDPYECFSQAEERDVLKETANIYKKAKDVCAREKKIIDDTAAEIEKTREKLAKLEEKMNRHRRILDNASKKLRAVEAIFGK